MPLKLFIGTIFFISSLAGYAQSIVISSGSISIKDSTSLTLSGTSLINNGYLSADDSTTLIIRGSDQLELGGSSEITSGNLKVMTDLSLNTILHLNGNISMSSGVFTLNYNMFLGGKIMGETEENRITSTGSTEIIKNVTLVANRNVNPGNIGIKITPVANYNQIEIRRGHQSILNGSSSSINRYYSFPSFNELTSIQFCYFDAELNGLTEGNLVMFGEQQSFWVPLQLINSDVINNFFTVAIEPPLSRISLFEGESAFIEIPTGISPNSDGINDLFILPDIENFPNNRLVIFNQWGDMLFMASPYQNDWGGESDYGIIKTDEMILPDGTYFFVFYPDRSQSQNFKSGSFEIKTKEKP